MKYRIRNLILIAALPLITIITVTPAVAHVLKTDNGITAVLHIPPEDNPVASQPTELDFSFSDNKNAFNLNDCNCQVAVKSNGKVLQTTSIRPALAGATLEGVAKVQFPAVGVYDLVVTGSPKAQNFASFQLDFLERVTGSANGVPATSGNGSSVLIISAGSLIILGMVGYTTIQRNRTYAPKPATARSSREPKPSQLKGGKVSLTKNANKSNEK